MRYSFTKCIALFSIILSFSTAWSMNLNHETDVESGIDSSESYSLLPKVNQAINPTNRKRSAWTNFYTAAGFFFGSGVTGAVTWHLANNNQSEAPAFETNVLVYSIGAMVASVGLCCYFTTSGANIFHSTCKKFMKKSETKQNITEESLSIQ